MSGMEITLVILGIINFTFLCLVIRRYRLSTKAEKELEEKLKIEETKFQNDYYLPDEIINKLRDKT